jgi:pimeloyl-ACP methyl ester carboxylesterase
MSRLVLVHGAWHGAWAWREVRGPLEDAGHDVVALDLPGTDGGGSATLQEQGEAVAAVLRCSPDEAVLVAHSHGGLVAQEAAASEPGRVRAVIGVDAWFAEPGETFLDVVPEWMRHQVAAATRQHADGVTVPAPPAVAFGVTDPVLSRIVESLLVPQPLSTFDAPSSGFSFLRAGIPGIGIVCEPVRLPFAALAARQGLSVRPVASGHDVMLLQPQRLVELVLAFVRDLSSGEAA